MGVGEKRALMLVALIHSIKRFLQSQNKAAIRMKLEEIMKGIILAGGSGTRLFPSTIAVSKQILPVYDKPTIYYPLSSLMQAGIREILIISTSRDVPMIQSLLKDGSHVGIKISYAVQEKPEGIAQAFLIAKDFIGSDSVCLILGDNIFYGENLSEVLSGAAQLKAGAKVFAYRVNDPERYGVVSFDKTGKAIAIEEKPRNPQSDWAVTGLYFYDNTVCLRAAQLRPSPRGELEITDLNLSYLKDQKLQIETLGRGVAWLDTGTDDSLLESSHFVQTIEKRQGLKIACIEEIAFLKKYISMEQFVAIAESVPESGYGKYLKKLARDYIKS